MTGNEPEILIEAKNGLGRITLNRPRAINALNHTMVQAMAEALLEWSTDDTIRAVVVAGAGERGLCAGGDIVAIYHDAKDGGTGTQDFWRDEYILNAAIGRYPKPYVAIMDGIVMGGGIGISAHGNVRIVTERSSLAMPEVGIGFIPDVGGTYLLSRAPGELGTHIALTTGRMKPATRSHSDSPTTSSRPRHSTSSSPHSNPDRSTRPWPNTRNPHRNRTCSHSRVGSMRPTPPTASVRSSNGSVPVTFPKLRPRPRRSSASRRPRWGQPCGRSGTPDSSTLSKRSSTRSTECRSRR